MSTHLLQSTVRCCRCKERRQRRWRWQTQRWHRNREGDKQGGLHGGSSSPGGCVPQHRTVVACWTRWHRHHPGPSAYSCWHQTSRSACTCHWGRPPRSTLSRCTHQLPPLSPPPSPRNQAPFYPNVICFNSVSVHCWSVCMTRFWRFMDWF